MAISMVRKPSETPNINNIDDIIPFRYAYGNQNGYVIGRGAEVSHTVNGNQFTINSGRLVIQGVESDIDANGVTLTIDPVSETRYYVIYHEINLATNTANIKVQFDTATYPTINEGDDLTQNSSGIANLILYRFIAQNGVISSVEKVVTQVKYSLNIKKDDSGILRIGDIVIPQYKKLLTNVDGVSVGSTEPIAIYTSDEDLSGKHLRGLYSFMDFKTKTYIDFMVSGKGTGHIYYMSDAQSDISVTVSIYYDTSNNTLYTYVHRTEGEVDEAPYKSYFYELVEIVE